MLRIARLTDPTGRYYLADLGVADPATAHAGPPRWAGRAAAGLGLDGTPDELPLVRVLHGAHPATGRALRSRHGTVAAYDLTFAPAKSVSILHGVGPLPVRAEVAAAHRVAVERAIEYVEARAATVRIATGEGRAVAAADGITAAMFEHTTSRALDPHLHTHVVVANLARGPDGRWRALDGRGLHAHLRAAGALYDAHLRHELGCRIGARWSARRSGAWELDDVEPAVIGAFSARRAAIAADAFASSRAVGRLTAGVRAVSWAATRPAKIRTVDPDTLRDAWRARLVDLEGSHLLAHRPLGPTTPRVAGDARLDEHRFAASLAREPGGPTRRAVVAAWADAIGPGAPADAVGACVEQLAAWGPEAGVAEVAHSWRTVVPSPIAERLLGPRPVSADDLGAWREAAARVDAYRRRWAVDDRVRPLGIDGTPAELGRLPVARLADHLVTTRVVDDLHRRLGRAPWPPQRVNERELGPGSGASLGIG